MMMIGKSFFLIDVRMPFKLANKIFIDLWQQTLHSFIELFSNFGFVSRLTVTYWIFPIILTNTNNNNNNNSNNNGHRPRWLLEIEIFIHCDGFFVGMFTFPKWKQTKNFPYPIYWDMSFFVGSFPTQKEKRTLRYFLFFSYTYGLGMRFASWWWWWWWLWQM